MGLLSALRLALGILLLHKGRTALTSLGITIGIAGVVAMVAAGDGARRKLDDRLESAGKNLIIVRPGARTGTGVVTDYHPLTPRDAEAIRREAGSLLVGVVPWQVSPLLAASREHTDPVLVVGTWPAFEQVGNWQFRQGQNFDAADLERAAAACVIGQTVRRNLFPHTANPVGEFLRLGPLRVRVVGVLAEKGSTPLGQDQDNQVFVPLSTLQQKLVRKESIAMLLATARSADVIPAAVETITRVLRRQHRLAAGAGNDFDVSSVRELADFAVTLTVILQALVTVIAAISLLVGGIGIMNIMLVSVTERTREIGIRMAVGATPASILGQFLLEAVVLSFVGGLAGTLLGIGAAVGLAVVADWPVTVSPRVVALAFSVTAAVGILFGYYPAWRASRLEPIDALHTE
jgi:putative ABC transport system permease protein